MPGLLVQLGMFGAFFAGFGLIGEWREGVVEAERVTPASRTALLVGRLSRDVVQLFVQALILVGWARSVGLTRPPAAGPGRRASALLAMIGRGCSAALSYAMALIIKSEDALAPLITRRSRCRCCSCPGSCCR